MKASIQNHEISETILQKLKSIKLFLSDVDGVLTDASVYVGESKAQEYKKFNIQDGLGIVLVRKSGIPVGWVSARFSHATELRAQELKIDYLVQGSHGKLPAIQELCNKLSISINHVLYMGDDIVDIPVLREVGLAIAVANARPEVKEYAHFITAACGGDGAVREICDLLLKVNGSWDSVTQQYFN